MTTRSTVTTGLSPANIDTRDIVRVLGTATGNTFSRSAGLVIVTPLGGGDSSIQVRDRAVRVDVTRFFVHEQLSEFVSGSVSNIASGRVVGLDYSIQRFALRSAEGSPALGLRFDVSGFAAERSTERRGGVSILQLDVSGTGGAGDSLLILRGDIEVLGDRLEVVPGDSGENT